MAISERLRSLLRDSNVKYTVTKHPAVYTAQEIAAAQHVPGRQLAKSVLVNSDRGPVLAVLPAIYLIDLTRLKACLRARTLAIAKEADIKERFPDVEVGAMSPFGNLYGIPVIVDRVLEASDEIVCNAGSHTETIKLRYADFARLVQPKLAAFGQPIGAHSGARPPRRPSARAKRPPHRTSRPSRTAKRPRRRSTISSRTRRR